MTLQAAHRERRRPAADGSVGELAPMVQILVQVTLDVFATMVRLPLAPSGPPSVGAARPPAGVIATVGFAGTANGLVSLGTSQTAGLEITGGMLGMDPASVEADLPDAIGEVTNMIAGTFRAKMVAGGEQWSITMPVVTVGHDLVGHSSGAIHVMCPFTMGAHALFVELALQAE